MTFALRYSEDIRRDFRRGYSFAGWGCEPAATRAECEAEYPQYEARYSKELGGWLPVEPGLCAVATGETVEEVMEAFEDDPRPAGFAECETPLWLFPCEIVRVDWDGWDVVRPLGPAKRVKGVLK